MKHTAVEWFAVQMAEQMRLIYGSGIINISILEDAKKMEKEQMIDAFVEGMRCQNFDPNRGRAEQYFNETFKTNEK
jgi:hypothetical protein